MPTLLNNKLMVEEGGDQKVKLALRTQFNESFIFNEGLEKVRIDYK